ncbi:DUF7948 domain-containing protein [Granulicella tundricola]|uniref:Uncharacterized protein n=1 Tax=Granulicella tundricola (strain ATCC BAA-1859 / DSM 23138 / MP5ACTX9) TaxID=1198114 RepID=E8X6G1_GRATM|nr:Ig-like domain repeat protein [Granulicella tundricola]ADW71045.1 hypothetical protein AciX9_4273 [Granulicella tundricola MP5ACTX9]
MSALRPYVALILALILGLALPSLSAQEPAKIALSSSVARYKPAILSLISQQERDTVSFIENKGQTAPDVLWTAQASGYRAAFLKDSFVLQTLDWDKAASGKPVVEAAAGSGAGSTVQGGAQKVQIREERIQLSGANSNAIIEPLDERTGKVNLFKGKDPSRWISNAPTYARLHYRNIYPGIDLIFYSHGGRLEYDFVVAAGANPDLIRMKIASADAVSTTAQGELRIGTTVHKPVLYQNFEHGKSAVEGSFTLVAPNTFGFHFAQYDKSRTFVIDPTISLLYSTYAGGLHNDQAFSITLDAQGNTFIAGWSASEDFPVTGNALQTVRKNIGVYLYDIVVMKFDSAGSLMYSTFLGGAQNDQGTTIVANADGSVYVGGYTQSTDFPVTSNAYQITAGGGLDGFLARISADGSQLLYSTYLGGTGDEAVTSLLPNADGSLWMSGVASQAGLNASATAYQKKPNGVDNSFVGKVQFDANGKLQIPYLTFIGGSQSGQTNGPGEGWPSSLAVDGTGNVYYAGTTQSSDYPVTATAYEQPVTLSHGCANSPNPNTIGVVTKFSPDLSQVLYSTYFGGKTEDQNGFPYCNQGLTSIHLDTAGDIWLYGYTAESDLPLTSNALSKMLNGNGMANGQDAFLGELSADGTKLLYGTYIGGSGLDSASMMTVDASGNIWLSGISASTDFPTTANALQPLNNTGGSDFTLVQLNPAATSILYSTYFGGTTDNGFNSVPMAVDANGNIHLTGSTSSASFPVTPNALQQVFANGDSGPDGNDIFYAELGTGQIVTATPSTGGNVGDATITVNGVGFQIGATCELTLNGATISSASASVSPTGTSISCTFPLAGVVPGTYNIIVLNPNNGTTFMQTAGFVVASGGGPQLWATIVGRPKIRTGVSSVVTVSYGNSGNTDAYMAPMEIDLPANVSATYGVGVSPKLGSGVQATTSATTASGMRIPLMVPHLAAGESRSYQIAITDAVDSDNYTISAQLGSPWYGSLSAANSELSSRSNTLTTSTSCAAALSGSPTVVDCLDRYLTQYQTSGATAAQAKSLAATLQTELAQSLIGNTPAVSAGTLPSPSSAYVGSTLVVTGLPSTDDTELVHDFATSTQYLFPIDTSHCVVWADNVNDALGGVLYKCTYSIPSPIDGAELFTGNSYSRLDLITNPGNLIPEFDTCWTKSFSVLTAGTELDVQAGRPCSMDSDADDPDDPAGGQDPPPPGPPDPPTTDTISGTTGGSIDPNAKVGNNGDGSGGHFIRATAPLPYAIFFENQATATLPAAMVVVTDQLDPAKVDLTTLSLGAISFGANVIKPKGTANAFTAVYSINSSLSVRIEGSLNQNTGLLKWTLQSIDPSTGLPPTDPTIGFLPADTDGMKGQASVVFNVALKPGMPTGTQISNAASIIFDTNTPITTPTWVNTIDIDAPVSRVTALPATETTITFPVTWSGTDQGSGIVTYNVYVSDNGGTFTLWQSAVRGVTANYTGTVNHTYGFYSVATDGVGNIEATKNAAETATQIVPGLIATTAALSASSTSTSVGTNVTFTATVTPSAGSGVPTGSVTFMDGTTVLGQASLMASGQAYYSSSSLAAGAHVITASYGGTSAFAGSTSPALTVTIQALPADFSIGLSPTSGSVTAGKSVTTAVSITPVNGFNQSVGFSCSGLPSGAGCSFSPATVTPAGGTAQTTLTIQTAQRQALLHELSDSPHRINMAVFGGSLLCLGFFTSKRRRWASLASLCLLATLMLGCGGGSPTAVPVTTTITITATAGSVVHSTSYTFTVQ